jgi:hypothetical protein
MSIPQRTPAQVAATEKLHAAIQECRAVYGGQANEFLMDWMVVSACTTMKSDEAEDTETYDLMFMDGAMPDYRAHGLLKVAERLLDSDWERHREE